MGRPDEGVAGLGEHDRVAAVDDLALDRVHQRLGPDARRAGRRHRPRAAARRAPAAAGGSALRGGIRCSSSRRSAPTSATTGSVGASGKARPGDLGIDVDVDEAAPRHEARVEQRRRLAEPRSEHEDARRRVLGHPGRHRLVAADAGDADEARMRLRERCPCRAACRTRPRRVRSSSARISADAARAPKPTQTANGLVGERAQAGAPRRRHRHGDGQRRPASRSTAPRLPVAPRGERRARALDARRLHRRRHRDVRDEAAVPRRCRARAAAATSGQSRASSRRCAKWNSGPLSYSPRGSVCGRLSWIAKRPRAGAPTCRPTPRSASRLRRAPPAGPVTALVRPGPVVVNTSTGRPLAKRRLGRRERRAALVAEVAHAQPARRHRVPEHRHRAARDAERLLDAEREQVVDQRRRERDRGGGWRRSTAIQRRAASPRGAVDAGLAQRLPWRRRTIVPTPASPASIRPTVAGSGTAVITAVLSGPTVVAALAGCAPDSLPRSCRASGSRRRSELSRSTQGVSRCGQAGGLPLMHGPEPWPTPK